MPSTKAKQRAARRESVQGVTKPAIKRLCRRAGVTRISGLIYQDVRKYLSTHLEMILNQSLTYLQNDRRKTLKVSDVVNGIEAAGGGKFVPSSSRKKEAIGQINFRTYLYPIMKQAHPDADITGSAMDEVNSIVFLIGKAIAEKASFAASQVGRKTITRREIQTAVRLVFAVDLKIAKTMVSSGAKALLQYDSFKATRKPGPKKVNVAASAGLQLSVARVRRYFKSSQKFLERTSLRVSSPSVVYLAAVLENVALGIFEEAGLIAASSKKKRITSRHLVLTFSKSNQWLCALARSLKITIGVSEKKKAASIKKKANSGASTSTRKTKPGTKARREVKSSNRFSHLVIAKASFKALVREIGLDMITDLRFTARSITALQEYCESYLVGLLTAAHVATTHGQRVTLMPKDLSLAYAVKTGSC